jgi:sucrose phosphorylase
VAQSGRSRTINRQKLERGALEAELRNPGLLRAMVFARYARLLAARAASPAFHPNGGQRIVRCGDEVFAVLRSAPDGSASVLCLQNVTDRVQTTEALARGVAGDELRDLITGRAIEAGRDGGIELAPYETLWLA